MAENMSQKSPQSHVDAVEKEVVPSESSSLEATGMTFPEGGSEAWLVIFGGFCLAIATLGFSASWGTFQEYYGAVILHSSSPSAIAWIGSIQYALIFLPGLPAGRLFEMGYFRILMTSSSILFLTANFLTAECQTLWQFLLCQGFALGLAGGFMYVPCVAASSQWFQKKRPIALSFVSLGVAVGGIIFPVMFRSLLPRIGKWTIRAMAFMNSGLFIIANLLIKTRLPAKGSRVNIQSFSRVLTGPFICYVLCTFFCFLGIYTMLTFLGVTAVGIGFSSSTAFDLIAIANANTAIGRILSGALASQYGIQNIMALFTIVAGITTYIWPFVENHVAFFVVTCIYGLGSGAFVGLLPAGVAQLGDIQDIAQRTGLQMSLMAIAAIIGPPISGAISSKTGNFKFVGIYAGSTIIIGVFFMLLTRYLVLRRIVGGRF